MRPLFIKFLIIIYLIILNINSSLAKEFKYDVRAYNLNVMDIIFNIDDEINNKITFSAESVGIVGFLSKFPQSLKLNLMIRKKKLGNMSIVMKNQQVINIG